MKAKRGKYDTNPLDDNVAKRADESWSQEREGPGTRGVGSATSEIGATRPIGEPKDGAAHNNSEDDTPTRLISDKAPTSYPSVFIPPKQPPADAYQPPRPAQPIYQSRPVHPANIYQPPPALPPNVYQAPPFPAQASRTVAGLGISEKWANLLPYIPGHIGAVAAVIELLLVPRTETRARFHAAQGLALQLAILIITGAFQAVSFVSGSRFGAGLFGAISTVFLIISMIRVFQGKPHHIAPLDEATKWLNEKINPRK